MAIARYIAARNVGKHSASAESIPFHRKPRFVQSFFKPPVDFNPPWVHGNKKERPLSRNFIRSLVNSAKRYEGTRHGEELRGVLAGIRGHVS